MFLSLSEKFVFLGNRKAASTSMERFLRLRCEVCASGGPELSDGRSSKHMTYTEWLSNYQDLLKNIRRSPEHFLIFGIIRDPLARLVSSYSFRNRHAAEPRSPDEFLAALASHTDTRLDPDKFCQKNFFADENGSIGPNFLIRLEHQEEDLKRLHDETGLDLRGAFAEQHNKIEAVEFDVKLPALRNWLEEFLEVDRQFYESSGGRLLKPVEPSKDINVSHAMRIMLRTNPTDLATTFLYNLRVRQAMDKKPHVMRVLKVARNATASAKAKGASKRSKAEK